MKMTRTEAAEHLDHLLCATVIKIESDRREIRGKKKLTGLQRCMKEALPLRIKNVQALRIAIQELRK